MSGIEKGNKFSETEEKLPSKQKEGNQKELTEEKKREMEINQAVLEEKKRQTREHFKKKAEEWRVSFAENRLLLNDMLSKIKNNELTTPQAINEFLNNPSSGKSIKDPDVRAIILESLEKIRPIIETNQSLETLLLIASNEGSKMKANQLSNDLDWYTKTAEGRAVDQQIRQEVERRFLK